MPDVINGAQTDWLALTRYALSDGKQWFDSGVRREIERDVRQFQGLHPPDSKYLSDAYRTRSRFFRPKTRSVIRKNEALAAGAFFSNTDLLEIAPWDDSDPTQRASADLNKQLVNWRLKRTIPWFHLSIGGYQDAQVNGVVCAHAYWRYDKARGIDEPCAELIPIENLSLSPNASWFDPVNTSPYLCHAIPMFVKDVQARMRAGSKDPKTGESRWTPASEGVILQAVKGYSDSIRLMRETGRADSQAMASSLTPYQLVWVYRNIADIDGTDHIWYTLGDQVQLTKGRPLEQSYLHGMRPYVIGYAVLEAHKIYPPGVARLTRDIQGEINENANQRSDNVKFAMNKRYFVKRGAQIDLRSISRNVPGSSTVMNDPEKDVKVVETKDVTASAYQEQDRLNVDFDELSGSNSLASRSDNGDLANKVGGAEMISEDANQIQGYQLRTYTETFVEPLLYQLLRLEQHYETDQDLLKLCATKANLPQEHGISHVDDNLIMQDLSLTVHVGIGATSPRKQLDNLIFAFVKLKELLDGGQLMQLGLDIKEIANEIFGKLGYRTADRFFKWDAQDPQVLSLQNQIQQLTDELKNKKDPPEIVAQKVELLKAQVKKTLNEAFNVNVEGLFGSMQAGEVVASVPMVGPVADTIARAAGYQSPNPPGVDPSVATQSPVPNTPPPAGLSFAKNGMPDAIGTRNTGINLQPGGGPPPDATQPGPPAGMPHNTHPTFPAKPGSADAGANRGIEGGR